MESQLSSAQDKIGAAERQSRDLTSKNQQLASEVESWWTAFQKQLASQTNPIGSSNSTVPQSRPTMQSQSYVQQESQPMFATFGMPQQQTGLRLSNVQIPTPQEPSFAETMQRQRRVSFGYVFIGSSGFNGE